MDGVIKIVECVPNFSEGRDADKVQQIVEAIARVADVKVLHVDSGYDANRTVITFAGLPQGVEEAAFRGIEKAATLIDMQEQQGTHPRIGATDVVPIVPITGVSIEETKQISYRLSERVARELAIPVYNYEKSAKKQNHQRLEIIRKGEYEGLKSKMTLADWKPDYGEIYNPRTGATVVGARHFLLAYNVNLVTRDVAVAKAIAERIRESGKVIAGIRQTGLFKGVKAIGWDVPEYAMVQVSTNITNTEEVGLHDVYEAVKKLALEADVAIAGSELIGLTPLCCLLASGEYYAGAALSEPEKIASAIKHLGLESVVPFDPQKRIIEYLL
ncbi:MAG: glutamate formimidoyltransferase [Bacteroidales bacterium]|jgi:glutamate formiminotransferase|nr:glutamate formimidoyltransferase [Bacteroidales bacterium]